MCKDSFELSYGESPRLIGDFFPAEEENAPIVLLIHGGGWMCLDRKSIEAFALIFQRNGMNVFNIEYRLSTEAFWPACRNDCLDALNFLCTSQNPALKRANQEKIAVVGASAGGHLALMTALEAPKGRATAAISISGITDMDTYRKQSPGCVAQLFGTERQDEDLQAAMREASPLALLKADSPAILLTHCPIDNVVEIRHAHLFMERATELGAPVEFLQYLRPRDSESSHCIWRKEERFRTPNPELESASVAFLRRILAE